MSLQAALWLLMLKSKIKTVKWEMLTCHLIQMSVFSSQIRKHLIFAWHKYEPDHINSRITWVIKHPPTGTLGYVQLTFNMCYITSAHVYTLLCSTQLMYQTCFILRVMPLFLTATGNHVLHFFRTISGLFFIVPCYFVCEMSEKCLFFVVQVDKGGKWYA